MIRFCSAKFEAFLCIVWPPSGDMLRYTNQVSQLKAAHKYYKSDSSKANMTDKECNLFLQANTEAKASS